MGAFLLRFHVEWEGPGILKQQACLTRRIFRVLRYSAQAWCYPLSNSLFLLKGQLFINRESVRFLCLCFKPKHPRQPLPRHHRACHAEGCWRISSSLKGGETWAGGEGCLVEPPRQATFSLL